MAAALGMMAVVSDVPDRRRAIRRRRPLEETTGKEADTTAAEADADTSADTKAPEAEASEAGAAGGTFTVGFDQEFPPMGFVGDDGEYTGFDLEVAKAVAERLGLEFVPQPVDWAAKDMELESGNIDCIWNGFTMTGREDDYTWSGSLYGESAGICGDSRVRHQDSGRFGRKGSGGSGGVFPRKRH